MKNSTIRQLQLGCESAGFGLSFGGFLKTHEFGYIIACIWVVVCFITHWELWQKEKKEES